MRIFFPVEDAVPDAGSGPLVPYRCGFVCAHALRGALEFRDGVWAWPDTAPLNDGSPSRRPAPLRSSAPGPR
jgi:hypothetical protein